MEKLVLQLTATGKSQREIGRTIGVAKTTVLYYQRKAKKSVEARWPLVAGWLFGEPIE
jgi:DNA-binding CsgD family transcriptional regulator